MTLRRSQPRIPDVGRAITPLEELASVETVGAVALLSAATTTSSRLALRFLEGAQIALNSGAFDAAYANATVAATAAVRVLVADQSGGVPNGVQGIVLVDTAEANGQLPHDIAGELRALLEGRGRGVFERVDRDDAAEAQRLASCVVAVAAGW